MVGLSRLPLNPAVSSCSTRSGALSDLCMQMRQWVYFHMACMKSMPDLLARKGVKMQQLLDFYAQRHAHERFRGSA